MLAIGLEHMSDAALRAALYLSSKANAQDRTLFLNALDSDNVRREVVET